MAEIVEENNYTVVDLLEKLEEYWDKHMTCPIYPGSRLTKPLKSKSFDILATAKSGVCFKVVDEFNDSWLADVEKS